MYTPTADVVARAFDLGRPTDELVHVRRGDTDTWRLEAGIDMPEPIRPADPFVGWATRVDGRLLRVHRWVEGRELRPDDDITG